LLSVLSINNTTPNHTYVCLVPSDHQKRRLPRNTAPSLDLSCDARDDVHIAPSLFGAKTEKGCCELIVTMATLATNKPTPTKDRKPVTEVTVAADASCADDEHKPLEHVLEAWRKDVARAKATLRADQEPDVMA
jgi:hypothetical protein